jgi:iron complex outermembrane receptor protein
MRSTCLSVLLGGVAAAAFATQVVAAERAFDIPRQPAPSALRAFGLQSGTAIVFRVSNVGRYTLPGVSGTMEPEVALQRLLEGTPLTFVRTGSGFAVVAARGTSEPASQTAAAASAALGPVERADSPAAPAAAPGATPAVETLVVTGSSIRGVAPVGAAIIGLSRDAIDATSPANAKELLSQLPQLGNFGANAEQSTPNRYRTAGFQPNIHNLGIFATLTLFNGHRMAPMGGEAVFPDPSIIPVIAVQRVEVNTDGASSIYGSDAVAGVVNFIYRRDVEGLEMAATYGANDTRYRKRNLGLIAGHLWQGGSVVAAYEFSDNRSALTTEIPFLALGGDQRSRGGRDLRSNNCLQPNVTVGEAVYAFPAWTPGRNVCGLLNAQTIIPDGTRRSALITLRQRLSENLEFWSEINWSRYETVRLGGRQVLNLTVPSSNPFFRLPPGVTASSVLVTRSGLGLFPGVVGLQSSEVAGVTLGGDIDLGGRWRGDLLLHLSKTQDFNSDPELDLVAAQRLANGTTPATALNPFGQAADNAPGVLSQINNNYSQINDTSQRLAQFQFKADGPLAALPGGDVRAAVGFDFRLERALQRQTAGSPGPSLLVVRDDDISRTVLAAFGELNVPIFGAGNARPGFRRLTLSVSGRYDDYGVLGGVFNPKYGGLWEPFDGIALHAAYGTSFAAPNIGLTTSTFTVPRPNTSLNLTDVLTRVYLGTVNLLNPGGGNPALTPEEATTKALGLDYAPTRVPELRLSANYYDVEYRNTVYTPTMTDILTDPQFAHLRIIHPTQAQIDDVLARMPPQQPITTGFDAIIYLNAQNIGMRQIAGVDLVGSYRLTTDLGVFDLTVNGNRQTRYRQRVSPAGDFTSRLGTFDAPRWKIRYGATWARGPYSAAVFANHVSGFVNGTVTPSQTVASRTTIDLALGYRLDRFVEGAVMQLRAVNLLNAEPPFYDSAAGYLAALASPFGRQLEATLRLKF